MPNEASKTRALWGPEVLALLRGDGLDVGCGNDPILPGVECFDKPQGDANHLSRYVTKTYDFVFASHALEHMHDLYAALRDWLSVVKPGGHLIAVVPDEDLYEQGHFPSLFNDDHKHTFTIRKARSWSAQSVNVLDLVKGCDDELVSVELHDQRHDRRLLRHKPTRHQLRLLALWRRMARSLSAGGDTERGRQAVYQVGHTCRPALPDSRLAQIQFILRRHAGPTHQLFCRAEQGMWVATVY